MARTPLFKKVMKILNAPAVPALPAVEDKISRREALGKGLAVGALVPLSQMMLHQAAASAVGKALQAWPRQLNRDPVTILGAGAAGLAAAYRLARAGIPCEIYEASSRLGGRIFTRTNFNADGMFCELGGELIDTGHHDLIQLCGELGLTIEELEKPGSAKLQPEIFQIEGRIYTDKELLESFAPLARHVRSDLKRMLAGHLGATPTYRNPYQSAAYDRMSLEEYLYSKRDVEKWVLDLVNLTYLCENGLETSEQSSLNLLTMISTDPRNPSLLGDSDESKRIRGGNGSLPTALGRKLEGHVPMNLGHELVRIRENGGRISLEFAAPGGTREVKARQVICTLPFSVLREVEGVFDLPLSAPKKACIRDLGYGTSSKFMLGFSERPWRDSQLGELASNGSIYTDRGKKQFWETSRAQSGSSGILTCFMGGKAGARVSSGDLGAILADLDSVYPGLAGRFDGNQALQRWPDYRFTRGAYSCWKPSQTLAFGGSPGEPELKGRLLFAGEHVSSEFGGFMNGAVQTGNQAARRIISQGVAPKIARSAAHATT